jgi:integrase
MSEQGIIPVESEASVSTLLASRSKPAKPLKPSPDFPLFAHGNGMWAKKVRGRVRYFGKWSDPDAALKKWNVQKDDLLAGRTPRPVAPDELLLHMLLNAYLRSKKALFEQGQIVERSWNDYLETCKRMAAVLGREIPISRLGPDDFQRLRNEMAKTWGPTRIGTEIRRSRMPFTWGVANGYLPSPPRYGEAMRRPSAKVLRKHRASKGLRMFEATQIREILASAGPVLKAMTLLGINCGFGNQDVALLRKKHIDLKSKWLDFPRPKTGISRRCPLWPETIAAIRRVVKLRKKQARKEDAGKGVIGKENGRKENEGSGIAAAHGEDRTAKEGGSRPPTSTASSAGDKRRRQWRKLVFLTKHGRPWLSKTGSPVSIEFGRLVKRLGLHREGLNFYALRHTFQTVADGAIDPQATSAIMAHVPRSSDMSAVYREKIDDARLVAISEHVRKWLFGEPEQGSETGKT